MNRKSKIIISITGISIVLLALLGITYAYYLTRIQGNTNSNSINVTTAKLELVYEDGSPEILRGESALVPKLGTTSEDAIGTKVFRVSNNGNNTKYAVTIDNVSIIKVSDGSETTFESNDFRYILNCIVKDKSGNVLSGESCNKVEDLKTFPMNGGILINNDIPENKVHEYTLTLWYIDTGIDQSADMGKSYQARVNIIAIENDNNDNDPQEEITSNFDFGWTEGMIDSSGELRTEGSTTLNNYYSDMLYFEKLELNLLYDNIMFKIAEYDENGNFIMVSAWQSKEDTQWTDGGTDSITIENKYVRIAIADTTINNSQVYTITPEQYSSRYSYVINGSNTESRFDFGWAKGTITNSTGEINTNGSQQLNNYYTPITYFEKIQLNLLTSNVMFKVVEYDEDGNFITAGSWLSKEETDWTDGGTNSIIIEDKYIRIAIADTTINNSLGYTITPSEYSDRYSYSIEGTPYRIGADNKLSAVQTIALPDIRYGEQGKGFTITGLTYCASDNTYYAGNYGKVYTSDTTVKNTIVHLSSDLKTNLGEIELPNTSEVQGVTIDSSDNTLWFVSPPDKKMYHISTSGEAIGEVNLGSNLTGIAYDSRTDTLWILDKTTLKNVEKNGSVNKTININISNVDQLYLDEADNSIYITAGNNYQGDSYVYKVNLSTNESKLVYTLQDSYAIEGIHIKDKKMYIGNDGVYHEAKIKSNIIQVYTIK